MGTHRLVSELSLDKPLLPVRVKVICKGPTVAGSGFQKTVLIIGDEKVSCGHFHLITVIFYVSFRKILIHFNVFHIGKYNSSHFG